MSKNDDRKREEAAEQQAKTAASHRDVQAAAHHDPKAPTPGSFETDEMRKAREDREKVAADAAAESGNDAVRMSAVNPRKPLDKEPVYAPGAGPLEGATGPGVVTTPDRRVPPENVTSPAPAPALSEPAKSAEPVRVPTPAQAGLPQPELRAGLDPLPEEDPTPSTVPIPPPGPRRVA